MNTHARKTTHTYYLLAVALLLLSAVFALVGFSPDQAQAATGDPATHSQAEIRNFVKSKDIDISASSETTYASTPSVTSPYAAGSVSTSDLNNALNTLNVYRYIAGVDADVTLNSTYNEYEQAGALVMAANNKLTHYPNQPSGMDSTLYNKGYTGTSKGNIAQGAGNLGYAVRIWIYDSISTSNLSTVGHRRWALSPAMSQTGFGQAESSSNTSYSGMYAMDSKRSSSCTKVAWPAANMPTELFSTSTGWSFSFKESEFGPASSMKVTLVRTSDNKTWNFSSSSSDGVFYASSANTASYGGLGGAVIFAPTDVDHYLAGDTYKVTITGTKKTYTYTVKFFDLYPIDKVTLYDGGTSASDKETELTNNQTINVTLGQTARRLFAIPGQSGATTANAKALASANNARYETTWTSSNPDVVSVEQVGSIDSGQKFGWDDGNYYTQDHIGKMTIKKAGTATISATINGVTQKVIVNVTAADLSKATTSDSVSSSTYTGVAQTPTAPSLTYSFKDQYGYTTKQTLTQGTDYTVTYLNNVNAGTASIVYTGIGKFTGTLSKTFTINKAKLTATYASETIEQYRTPAGAVNVTGFVNGETAATAKDYVAPTVSLPSTRSVGTYTRTPSGGSAANYSFTYKSGTLTVTKHEHSYTLSSETPATCTQAGSRVYTCWCGASYTETIAALGHNYVAQVTKQATCTSEGVTTYTCSRCGDSYTKPIAKTAHTPVTDAAVAPTCTETGLTEGSHCSVCGTVLKAQQIVAALGHQWGEWTVTKQPTTEATGEKTRTCLRGCGATETQVVPKLDPTPTPTPTPQTTGFTRLSGEDRYGTMSEVVGTEESQGTLNTIYLTSGQKFPDALASAGLAGTSKGTIVLTTPDALSTQAQQAINAAGANTKVVIVGGTSTVSTAVQDQVAALVGTGNVSRIAGNTRTDTAVALYKAAKGSWGTTAIIASGYNSADSLSVSSYAYVQKAPIFLAEEDGTLSGATRTAIEEGGFTNVIIVGGTRWITEQTQASLGATRIAGDNRYETSALIAQAGIDAGMGTSGMVIASGEEGKYPDALAGGSLAGRSNAVMLLVSNSQANNNFAANFIKANNVKASTTYLLGGTGTISADTASYLAGFCVKE